MAGPVHNARHGPARPWCAWSFPRSPEEAGSAVFAVGRARWRRTRPGFRARPQARARLRQLAPRVTARPRVRGLAPSGRSCPSGMGRGSPARHSRVRRPGLRRGGRAAAERLWPAGHGRRAAGTSNRCNGAPSRACRCSGGRRPAAGAAEPSRRARSQEAPRPHDSRRAAEPRRASREPSRSIERGANATSLRAFVYGLSGCNRVGARRTPVGA
jgi:hypothetical protein